MNLRPEEKAFQTSTMAKLRATASQAELLPRLHLQKANKTVCEARTRRAHYETLYQPSWQGRLMVQSCVSSVPEPVISPGNNTWPLGGNPGTSEGLCNTPESCSLDNVWHPSSSSKGAKPADLRGQLLQDPSMGVEGLKRSAGEGACRRTAPELLNWSIQIGWGCKAVNFST